MRASSLGYLETMKRLKDGAIGDIVATAIVWNGDRPWKHTRADLQKSKKDLTEMEYQMRNWYYFVWMCGDHIVEQHIHNLDVGNWFKRAPRPRQRHGGFAKSLGPDDGEIFDHHCVDRNTPDGSRMFSQCRHITGCDGNVSEHAIGTKVRWRFVWYDIRVKGGENWKHNGRGDKDPYQVEHDDLFAAIREGKPYNEGDYGTPAP